MIGFEKYGEAMLLANDGNAQLAAALSDGLKKLAANLRGWLRAMPGTLPPTESFQRK